MSDSTLTIPDNVTFQDAIALTQTLLAQLERGNLSEAELQDAIASLVSTLPGARGFFVTYLTDERPFADNPTPAVIDALRYNTERISDLMVKNIAMSTAMSITHQRNQDEKMAASSQRVRSRSAKIIKLLQLPEVQERSQQLYASATTGNGSYQEFLSRWGYDPEQRQAIAQALEPLIS
ncbi:MAG: hypothetical protein EBE86_020670 [Hormoscilla sp. GUM202]|nr:hypothetical protein [Hormoscilla sp. GUM202]